MSKIKSSHFNEVIKTSSKGVLTYYYFCVSGLEISEEIFSAIKNNKNIEIIKNKDLSNPKIKDHVKFLFSKIESDLIIPEDVKEIRVSVSGIVNITYKENSVLFKSTEGEIKPFGGAYLFKEKFRKKFPYAKLDDSASLDLRFKIPVSELENIKNWIYSKKDRENSPTRELFEEFCLENDILCKTLFNKLIF